MNQEKIIPKEKPSCVPSPPDGWTYVGAWGDIPELDNYPYAILPGGSKTWNLDGAVGDSRKAHYALPNDHPLLQETEDLTYQIQADGTQETAYDITLEVQAPSLQGAIIKAEALLPEGADITIARLVG